MAVANEPFVNKFSFKKFIPTTLIVRVAVVVLLTLSLAVYLMVNTPGEDVSTAPTT